MVVIMALWSERCAVATFNLKLQNILSIVEADWQVCLVGQI
jgi:hypothetical protein